MNSSETSRGSAPKIGRVAIEARFAELAGLTVFASTYCSSVCASHSAASGASQGASTGTLFDFSSRPVTTTHRSGRITGSGGAEPVGEVSLNRSRLPLAM